MDSTDTLTGGVRGTQLSMDYPRMSGVFVDSADTLTEGVGNSAIYGLSPDDRSIRGFRRYSDRGGRRTLPYIDYPRLGPHLLGFHNR